MLGLRVEHRPLKGHQVARDIAERISTLPISNVAVVTDQPAQTHAAIRKELHHLALQGDVVSLLPFSSDTLDNSLDAHAVIATADAFLVSPPMCRTIYVTCVLDQITLHRITSFMPPQALVVLYVEPTNV